MQTFTMGQFRFDVLERDHQATNGVVRDRFIVEAFHQGEPLDWHPNQEGADDFPGLPHRQVFEFVGKEEKHPKNELPRKFELVLFLKARKALAAKRRGTQIRHIGDGDIE